LEENYPAALREWKMLLKKAPHQPDLREYIEKGEKMLAIQQLEELKREKVAYSESIDTLAKKAYSYYSLNQIDKAIEMWSRVVALDPQNQDAQDALKKARERKNLANDDVADNKSRQIQELNSQAMNAYVNGDLNQAAAIWKKALEISPNDLRLQNNLRRIESELLGRKAAR
jgi:tetratricopeptide (TPR) repeat protein